MFFFRAIEPYTKEFLRAALFEKKDDARLDDRDLMQNRIAVAFSTAGLVRHDGKLDSGGLANAGLEAVRRINFELGKVVQWRYLRDQIRFGLLWALEDGELSGSFGAKQELRWCFDTLSRVAADVAIEGASKAPLGSLRDTSMRARQAVKGYFSTSVGVLTVTRLLWEVCGTKQGAEAMLGVEPLTATWKKNSLYSGIKEVVETQRILTYYRALLGIDEDPRLGKTVKLSIMEMSGHLTLSGRSPVRTVEYELIEG